MDADGAVWVQQADPACVRLTAGGEVLDRVALDSPSFACMLGGHNARVYVADAPAPHAGWP